MRMDYRAIIKNDVDWLFEWFELERMEIGKSVEPEREWDYILKLKMGAGIAHPASNKEDPPLNDWCAEGKHWGVPINLTNPDKPLMIYCAFCGEQLHSSNQKVKNNEV